MANWSETWNNKFLDHLKLTGQPFNDATGYGVRIEPVTVQPGQKYWRCIGVHHLTPEENRGNHSVFLDALDENGNRENIWIGWTWEGRRPDEPARPVKIDKPATEAGADIAMHAGQKVDVWAIGPNLYQTIAGDKVTNLHTGHPDEAPGNTWGHHSFYVVWQWTTAGSGPEPEPPDPPDPPDPAYTIASRVVYDITDSAGDFVARTDSLHTARQIVAALMLFKASSKDSRLEEYVKAIEKWNRGER